MKVAINNLPLRSAHKYRGIGYYTRHLLDNLKHDELIKLQEFSNLSEIKDANVIHYPWFDFFFHTLPIRKPLPTVITIHDVIPLIFPSNYPVGVRGKINFLLQEIALKGCKYIITDSKNSKADLIKYLKIDDKKIVAVPLAPDPKFRILKNDTELLHIKRKYRLPDKFLLYVGDANWIKNLPFLIEGFRQLIKLPEFDDVKLVLIGGVFLKDVENIDHPEMKSLKIVNQLIKQYGLNSFVFKPGQVKDEDLVGFYNLAMVYIQPSLYEGFGLPILEAFACGTPVISSNKGSLQEIGGESAIYFDPNNLKQFILIVKEVLDSRSLQSKLSKLGTKQVSKFSWHKTAEETKLVYLKAVNE